MQQNDKILSTEEEKELELEARKWKNRRRMAWYSLYFVFVMVSLLISTALFSEIPESRFNIVEDVIIYTMFGLIGIITAYFGLNTFQEWGKRK